MSGFRRERIGLKLIVARQLRKAPTPAERHAWTLLRNRRLLGLKFRRQHVLHGFIVDFYCDELRLVLELEGERHEEPTMTGYDRARAGWLRAAGYHVIRILNRDLNRDRLGKLIGQVIRSVKPMTPDRTSPLSRQGEGVRG